ncbi:MAG: hypothetical protein EA428_13775 [Spirochaetaceae bacterium]|nr:MAG: hypothetical protein EA428_13775 [Spirochaetaceae bacterium]
MRHLVASVILILVLLLPSGSLHLMHAQEIAPYRLPVRDEVHTNRPSSGPDGTSSDALSEAEVGAPDTAEIQLVLESVTGSLELLTDEGWKRAESGTVLRPEDMVRISGATELRFSDYSEPVYLFRRGSYRVGDVYAAKQIHRGVDIRSLGGEDGFRFPPAVAELLHEYGIDPQGVFHMLEQGSGGLLAEFQDSPLGALLGLSIPASEDLVGLIEAWSSVLRHQIGAALERLQSMRSRPGDPFYHEQMVLHATLLIESFAYADALELLRGYVRTIDRDDTAALQRAYLLTALAFHGIGNRGAAHMYLRQTRELDPASTMGDTARELLVSM